MEETKGSGRMKTRALILVGLAGLVIGSLATVAGILFNGDVIGGVGLPLAKAKPSGRVLMIRVADSFVGADPAASRGGGPASFYDVPKPFGSNLCRVNRYVFAEKVVRGRQERVQEYFDDNLRVVTAYGLAPDRDPGKEACARYRDFSHLIGGEDGTAVDRAVSLLRQAKSGSTTFRMSCRDNRTPETRSCNAAVVLAGVNERNIGWIEPVKERRDEHAFYRTDEMTFRPTGGDACSRPTIVIMRLDSQRRFDGSGRDDVMALNVELTTVC